MLHHEMTAALARARREDLLRAADARRERSLRPDRDSSRGLPARFRDGLLEWLAAMWRGRIRAAPATALPDRAKG